MSEASAFSRSGDGDAFPEENSEMDGGGEMTSVDMTIGREVRGNFMEALQCIYCTKILQAPISVCENGHSCCGDCRAKINVCGMCRGHFVSSSNRLMENLLMTCATPCDFAQLGCPEIVQLDKFDDHLALCVHNPNPPEPETEVEPEPEFQMEDSHPELDQMEAQISLMREELEYSIERLADAERTTSDIFVRLSVNSPSSTMATNVAPDRSRNDYQIELAGVRSRFPSRPVHLASRPRAPAFEQRAVERFRNAHPTLRNSFAPVLRNSFAPVLRNSFAPVFRNSIAPVLRNSIASTPSSRLHSSSTGLFLPEIPSVQPLFPSTLRGTSGRSTEYRSSLLNRNPRPSSSVRPVLPPQRVRLPTGPDYRHWNTRQILEEDSHFSHNIVPAGRSFSARLRDSHHRDRDEDIFGPFRHESFYPPREHSSEDFGDVLYD